jgi:Asp-tRNA(Asn)/Glu-tRNA(Gln) amidotransferase A subunit family amidase
MTEAYELTATEGVREIEGGNLTAEAWLASCLERIDAREEAVLAWQYLDRDGALARARELDKSGNGGIAKGVPFGVKDIIDTADMPTEYGSPIHKGHRPGRDAGCVAIMRGGGAVLLGKTVSTEFGHLFPGNTRNPFNPSHTPGGSSSGSAAAVGDKMIPVSYGTQTTGSVIRPAAYCATVGYMPTHGDFNNNGVMPNTPTIDTLGVMVRSVEDLALIRSVLLEEALVPLKPPAISDLTIGLYRSPFWDQAEDYTQSFIEDVATKLSSMGATVTDVELPGIDADILNLHGVMCGFEFARTVAWERLNRLDLLSKDLREGRMKLGMKTSYEEYRAITMRFERLRLEIDEVFESFDAFISPTAPGEPPEGLRSTGSAIFNSTWTALGTPVVTLPLFEGPTGLPVGMQLIAGRTKDRRLFNVAEAVMEALG